MSQKKTEHDTHLAIAAAVLAMALVACNQASQPEPAAAAPAKSEISPTRTATSDPDVSSMHAAIPSAKMSVAADLKYQFDGSVVEGQPVTLHLAVIPRVAASNLNVSVKQVDGLQIAMTPLTVQKATASNVYRQQLSITKTAVAPSNLRVLVTMDMPEGKSFGFFSVPLDGSAPAQTKQDSPKLR